MTGVRRPKKFAEMTGIAPHMPIRPIIRDDSPWNSQNEDEAEWWPRILWIDPGVVSGVACTWFDPVAVQKRQPLPRCILARASGFLYGDEVGQSRSFINIAAGLDKTAGLAVGVESFTILKMSQDKDFLSPVRIRAQLDFYFAIQGRALHSQSPSEAKTSITDARLKLWDLWDAGADHQRDALKHSLLWLKKLRETADPVKAVGVLHGEESGWWSP